MKPESVKIGQKLKEEKKRVARKSGAAESVFSVLGLEVLRVLLIQT
jgi:hypothetical protein